MRRGPFSCLRRQRLLVPQSATIGSSTAARRAGHTPKITPTRAEKANAAPTTPIEICVLNPATLLMTIAPPVPTRIPMMPPKTAEHDGFDEELRQDIASAWRRAPCECRSRAFAR